MVGTFSALGMLLLLLVTATLAGPGSCRGERCPCGPGSTRSELPGCLATKVNYTVSEAQNARTEGSEHMSWLGWKLFLFCSPSQHPRWEPRPELVLPRGRSICARGT